MDAAVAPVRVHTVSDSTGKPVAVQVTYDDWQRIEPVLHEKGLIESPKRTLTELAEEARKAWCGEDGLAFQTRLRAEWEDRQ